MFPRRSPFDPKGSYGDDPEPPKQTDINICYFPKHYGMTWDWVVENQAGYVKWLLTNKKSPLVENPTLFWDLAEELQKLMYQRYKKRIKSAVRIKVNGN